MIRVLIVEDDPMVALINKKINQEELDTILSSNIEGTKEGLPKGLNKKNIRESNKLPDVS